MSKQEPEWAKDFSDICQKPHSAQAKWYLNGFWKEGGEQNAEEIWNWTHLFMELESGQKILYGSKNKKIEEK